VEYLDIDAARKRRDLCLVLTAGVPGPWGEAAKGILRVKKIAYVPVAQRGGGENAELRAWTGHDNAPIVVVEGEPPLTGWREILFFAERRQPEPALIPADPADRALMFGLAHEICGEQGLGWSRRLMMLDQILGVPALADSPAGALARNLGAKYGYRPEAAAAAPGRAAEVLGSLAAQLRRQHGRGSRYLVGNELSALDIYWAAFAALVKPLPHDQCPMPDFLRVQYEVKDPSVLAALDSRLLAHRDSIYADTLGLPLDF
jgi:glutathione S-transferase